MKNETSIAEKVETGLKIVSLIALASLFFGALIWNYYLVRIDLYEFQIIQLRFVASGLLFIAAMLAFLGILDALRNLALVALLTIKTRLSWTWTVKIAEPLRNRVVLGYLSFFAIIFFFFPFYMHFIFLRIPEYFGGGMPRVVSIIGSEEEINYLSNFGPDLQRASPVQTSQFCLAYENGDSIIALLSNRVISIKKETFSGLVSLPSRSRDAKQRSCISLAQSQMSGQDRVWDNPAEISAYCKD